MPESTELLRYLGLFGLATAAILCQVFERKSVGLGLAYAFQLWLLFGAGACLHALPWSELPDTPAVYDGFVVATCGILAFAAGCWLQPHLITVEAIRSNEQSRTLPGLYVMAGCLSYFVLVPTVGKLPTFNALTSVGQQLAVVGLCLGAYMGWKEGGWMPLLRWSAPAVLFPIVTMANQGFLGFGIIMAAMVAIFCATFVKPRWVVAVAACCAVYGGLSVYTAYMRDRNEIRAVVWGEEDWSSRLGRLARTFSTVEPFNLHNQQHLLLFDERMDQNVLLGLAVENLSKNGDYANGETLRQALIAWIPRVIWPDKPVTAGSGGLVTKYTGVEFAQGTSVGIGSVLEFYINFGVRGVVIGFLCLGVLLTYIEAKATAALAAGNWQLFVLWFLTGISFLQAGGSFVEVVSSAGASIAVAQVVNTILAARARQIKKKSSQFPDRLQIA